VSQLLVILLMLMQANQPALSTWTVRDHLPVNEFVIQSHRGAGVLAPENTPQAFELGWKLNTIPEADVRTTKDGVIVAFHDNDFSRVVRNVAPDMAKKGVKDVAFDELIKLDVGEGRKVARMSEIFALMSGHPERRLYLDIKQVDLKQLAGEVTSADVQKQVIFASTKYDLVRKWKQLVPESQTLLWMGGTEEKLTARFDELRQADFADVTQVQIHTHLKEGVSADAVTRASVDPFQECDKFLIARGDELRGRKILFQTLPYGGSSAGVYQKLLDLGLMSFATDHPDVTWDAVKSYYKDAGK
jgi:glycerophosphoryl diester phosphodiesterase